MYPSAGAQSTVLKVSNHKEDLGDIQFPHMKILARIVDCIGRVADLEHLLNMSLQVG